MRTATRFDFILCTAFSALTLLAGRQEGHLAAKQKAQLSPRDRAMRHVS